MRAFGSELEEARRERDELIAELRYAMTHLGEVVDDIVDSYVAKWNRFEALSQERTLGSQFEAGRIFGEVLLEVVSLIGGGAAALKAASKLPRLARLAQVEHPSEVATTRQQRWGRARDRREAVDDTEPGAPCRGASAEPPPPKPPPPKSVASALAGSEFNGVKAERIRPGSDTKVAVVGRNMEQVEKYAQGLKDNGYPAEVFAGDNISPFAQDQWVALKSRYTPNRVPDSVGTRVTVVPRESGLGPEAGRQGLHRR